MKRIETPRCVCWMCICVHYHEGLLLMCSSNKIWRAAWPHRKIECVSKEESLQVRVDLGRSQLPF